MIVVFITTPKKDAYRIAKELIKNRVSACVNIVKEVNSLYWWKNKIVEDKEALLIVKTRKAFFTKLKKTVEKIHPYTVPEIVALPVCKVNKKYKSWLYKETE